MGTGPNTELCFSAGKVTLAFGISALLFSMVTAYKVTALGQPAFFFLGVAPGYPAMWEAVEADRPEASESLTHVELGLLDDEVGSEDVVLDALYEARPAPRPAVMVSVDVVEDKAGALADEAREIRSLIHLLDQSR